MSGKFDPRCHVGEVHGIYTIVDMLDKKDKYGHWIYKGVCSECGREKFAAYGRFTKKSKAYKCNHLRANGQEIVYGYTWNNSRIARIFKAMMSRCYNTNNKDYRHYGGKGVSVYQEWIDNPKSFESWALNNGYSDNLTIDRIYSDGNYYPENCRWIPIEENTRRAGKVNWITVNGVTLTGRQWAEKLGLGALAINKYINRYGFEKTKELITAILIEPLSTKNRKTNQTWFSVYGIQV